jgi:hypothetical protein
MWQNISCQHDNDNIFNYFKGKILNYYSLPHVHYSTYIFV